MFLTSVILNWIRRALWCAELVQALPFKWNCETNRVEVQSGSKLAVFHWNYRIVILHSAFVWYSCIETLRAAQVQQSKKMIAGYFAVYWTFQVLLTTSFVLMYNDFAAYLNKSLQFLQDYSKEFNGSYGGKPQKVPLLTKANQVLCFATFNGLFAVYVLWNLWVLVDPKLPTLVGPYLSSDAWMSRFTSSVVIIYIGWNFWAVASLLMMVMNVVLVGFLAVDTELRSVVFKTAGGGRGANLQKSISYYNEGQILLGLHNNVYSKLIMPSTELFFLLTCVFGFYGLIRLEGFTAAIVGFLGFYTYFALILLFRMPAEFYLRSEGYLIKWARCLTRASAADRRSLKAARPWKVTCGFYAFIDAGLILTVTHLVFANVVQMLMLDGR